MGCLPVDPSLVKAWLTRITLVRVNRPVSYHKDADLVQTERVIASPFRRIRKKSTNPPRVGVSRSESDQHLSYQLESKLIRPAEPLNPDVIITCEPAAAAGTPLRRPNSYKPSMWNYGFIQSLGIDYMDGQRLRGRMEKLKQDVRELLGDDGTLGLIKQLELVDLLEGLGVGRHFEEEIHSILLDAATMASDPSEVIKVDDLSSTALLFRLLRQRGYGVSEDIFSRFGEEKGGSFQVCLHGDIREAIRVHEATHYVHRGERMLDAARAAAVERLENLITAEGIDSDFLREEVEQSLELPLNRRIGRLRTHWLLSMSARKADMIYPALYELAVLDFNMVQSQHRGDLRKMSSWWMDLGLKQKLSFARDRIMENFFCSIGIIPDPEFSSCREKLTQVSCLISTIDDLYDEYGTYDELQLFSNAVERWDVTAIDDLPQYMQPCYLALLRTVGHMSQEVQKERGLDVLPHLKKAWVDLCGSFLMEAKWCNDKHMPTFEQYMCNGYMSASVHVMLAHAILFMNLDITEKELGHLQQYPPLIRFSATIFRLCNDLVEREGFDTPSSIACYMNENNATEEAARRHIRDLVDETWSSMNQEIAESSLPPAFTAAAANVARLGHCLYQHGDGHSNPGKEFKNRVRSILLEPIIPPKQAAIAEDIILPGVA